MAAPDRVSATCRWGQAATRGPSVLLRASRRSGSQALVWALVLMVSAGCSWERFDDLEHQAPVLLLKKPKQLRHGFGHALATATREPGVRLLVTGAPGRNGAALFSLGLGEDPTLDAIDTSGCSASSEPCALGSSVAALAHGLAPAPEGLSFCMVSGLGKRVDQAGASYGLIARCEGERGFLERVLPVPAGLEERLHTSVDSRQISPVALGSDLDPLPWLAAAWPAERVAWYYEPDSSEPRAWIDPGTMEQAFSTVAVLRLGEDRLLALGAPEAGEVWLWRARPGAGPVVVGCLGGWPGLGRALAVGRVDGDEVDDLVVSDRSLVSVFSGRVLGALEPRSEDGCALAALPQEGLVASFTCGSEPPLSGCEASDFGASVAVGDLDGDGDGEVVVGAPGMQVADADRAGAVLAYDLEGDQRHALTQVYYLSSAEPGDELGQALVTPRLGWRSIVAAGAPGGGKAALFYCSARLASPGSAERCR